MVSHQKNPSAQLLSLKKAAEKLDVSVSTLRRLLTTGALPGLKIGGQLRIVISDLQAFVNSSYLGIGDRGQT